MKRKTRQAFHSEAHDYLDVSPMAGEECIFSFENLKPDETTLEDGEDVNIPSPRSGHRIIVDNTSLYSIGGFNPDFWNVENTEESYYPLFRELWSFSFSRRKWQRLKTSGYMPVELASHSALLHGRHMLVYGGTGVPFGESASNDLHVCNLETLEWSQIETDGCPPIRSYGHAMFLFENSICVFGGTTGWEYNSELFRLDLSGRKWEHIEAKGQEPHGRYRHEVALHDKKLYVFGGGRASASYEMERIPVCDLESASWSVACTHPDRNSNCFPAARRCHSAVQIDNCVYICGGYDGTQIFDDLWEIDLKTLRWRCLPARLPLPVYFHAAAVTRHGYMVIYGGVTKIDTKRTSEVFGIWLRIPPLRELAWRHITKSSSSKISSLPPARLHEMGIPADLTQRLR